MYLKPNVNGDKVRSRSFDPRETYQLTPILDNSHSKSLDDKNFKFVQNLDPKSCGSNVTKEISANKSSEVGNPNFSNKKGGSSGAGSQVFSWLSPLNRLKSLSRESQDQIREFEEVISKMAALHNVPPNSNEIIATESSDSSTLSQSITSFKSESCEKYLPKSEDGDQDRYLPKSVENCSQFRGSKNLDSCNSNYEEWPPPYSEKFVPLTAAKEQVEDISKIVTVTEHLAGAERVEADVEIIRCDFKKSSANVSSKFCDFSNTQCQDSSGLTFTNFSSTQSFSNNNNTQAAVNSSNNIRIGNFSNTRSEIFSDSQRNIFSSAEVVSPNHSLRTNLETHIPDHFLNYSSQPTQEVRYTGYPPPSYQATVQAGTNQAMGTSDFTRFPMEDSLQSFYPNMGRKSSVERIFPQISPRMYPYHTNCVRSTNPDMVYGGGSRRSSSINLEPTGQRRAGVQSAASSGGRRASGVSLDDVSRPVLQMKIQAGSSLDGTSKPSISNTKQFGGRNLRPNSRTNLKQLLMRQQIQQQEAQEFAQNERMVQNRDQVFGPARSQVQSDLPNTNISVHSLSSDSGFIPTSNPEFGFTGSNSALYSRTHNGENLYENSTKIGLTIGLTNSLPTSNLVQNNRQNCEYPQSAINYLPYNFSYQNTQFPELNAHSQKRNQFFGSHSNFLESVPTGQDQQVPQNSFYRNNSQLQHTDSPASFSSAFSNEAQASYFSKSTVSSSGSCSFSDQDHSFFDSNQKRWKISESFWTSSDPGRRSDISDFGLRADIVDFGRRSDMRRRADIAADAVQQSDIADSRKCSNMANTEKLSESDTAKHAATISESCHERHTMRENETTPGREIIFLHSTPPKNCKNEIFTLKSCENENSTPKNLENKNVTQRVFQHKNKIPNKENDNTCSFQTESDISIDCESENLFLPKNCENEVKMICDNNCEVKVENDCDLKIVCDNKKLSNNELNNIEKNKFTSNDNNKTPNSNFKSIKNSENFNNISNNNSISNKSSTNDNKNEPIVINKCDNFTNIEGTKDSTERNFNKDLNKKIYEKLLRNQTKSTETLSHTGSASDHPGPIETVGPSSLGFSFCEPNQKCEIDVENCSLSVTSELSEVDDVIDEILNLENYDKDENKQNASDLKISENAQNGEKLCDFLGFNELLNPDIALSPQTGDSAQEEAVESSPKRGSRGTRGQRGALGSDTHVIAYLKDRQKKDNHNMIERRRRFNINDRIRDLSHLLPKTNEPYHELVRDIRHNKGQILRASVDYIQRLKTDLERTQQGEERRKFLETQNRQLLLRVQNLEHELRKNGISVDEPNLGLASSFNLSPHPSPYNNVTPRTSPFTPSQTSSPFHPNISPSFNTSGSLPQVPTLAVRKIDEVPIEGKLAQKEVILDQKDVILDQNKLILDLDRHSGKKVNAHLPDFLLEDLLLTDFDPTNFGLIDDNDLELTNDPMLFSPRPFTPDLRPFSPDSSRNSYEDVLTPESMDVVSS